MDECELQAELDRKRAAAEADHKPLRDDLAHRRRLSEISRDMGALTPDQFEVRRQEAIEREAERQSWMRHDRWLAFVARRGDIYGNARIANYSANNADQQTLVDRLSHYCAGITDEIASGTNIILFGSMGTGKDHLLAAVTRAAIMQGKIVDWWNGMDLFGRVRDRMSSDDSEEAFVRVLTRPNVLYISDPLPPGGEPLTAFQMQFLSRVVDARYSRGKPIWLSVNTLGRKDFEARLGAPIVDRLCDRALAYFCNWPSYRKAK